MVALFTGSNKIATHFSSVTERFFDDASFLWVLRNLAVKRPNYQKADVLELEERIEAHLDGLACDPEHAWSLCESAFEFNQPGETFVAAILAFRSMDTQKIQSVVERGVSTPTCFSALASALAWLPGRLVHSWVKKFLTSKDMGHKYLAVTVCSLRREDPREYLTNILQRDDCREHSSLYARAIRLVGELKRRDLNRFVLDASIDKNPAIQFWGLWSSILLGDWEQVSRLYPYVMKSGNLQPKAVEMAFRVLPFSQAKQWVDQLAKQPENTRYVIKASEIIGNPQAVPWLIQQMRTPTLTRLAGEAFANITGIELEKNALALAELPNLETLFPDDTDAPIEWNDDEDLPFPDVDKVGAVWEKYQHHFAGNKRYFLGKPVEFDHLQTVYQVGNQRQRQSAALALALQFPDQLYLNASARLMTVD